MDWQLVLAGLVVALAAGYLLRQTWRSWTVSRGCGGKCGCAPDAPAERNGHATLIPAEQVTLRKRSAN